MMKMFRMIVVMLCTSFCYIESKAMMTIELNEKNEASLSGTIFDAQTHEPLIGATIMVEGTYIGTSTDISGRYNLNLKPGRYTLSVRFIGYKTFRMENFEITRQQKHLDFELVPDVQSLGEIKILGKINRESERALQTERIKSVSAVENMGAQEMSTKGLSNVEESVKKISGVSVADEGNLVVRGLGDRYSLTELNGLTIASPNPDNKLIPLSLFPSSVVQDITVSKVYTANSFADYSGALIDIKTKSDVANPFMNVSFHTGGYIKALGKDTYRMDSKSLFSKTELSSNIMDMTLMEFDDYASHNRIFPTSMDVKKSTTLPDLGGTLNVGQGWRIGGDRLDVIGSITLGNNTLRRNNSFYKTLEATGNVQDNFIYDEYVHKLNIASIGAIGYCFKNIDRIGYTFFYARDAQNVYQNRRGIDAEGHNLLGSNSVTHIYKLMNHQIQGNHTFGKNCKLFWKGSYSNTSSDEPDRRQIMFENVGDSLRLFKLNRQETMRYFGSLNEDEWIGRTSLQYTINKENTLNFGADYKNKHRNYQGTRFYYNLSAINPFISDILTPSEWLDMSRVRIERKMQPKDTYKADMNIVAGYVLGEFIVVRRLTLSPGVRFEHSMQSVDYTSDGGEKFARRREMMKDDFFPTFNAKYNIKEKESIRLSLSRTVTRPGFIEMAPFLYQESYGSAQIRGNEKLMNGYNYNFDIRYEKFFGTDDLISLAGYYKYLDNPIERVQGLNGGATVHTFQNADNGIAAGVEVELRKRIGECLRFTTNISYMYTNVKLPEGGAYTNKDRALQGASPILLNADLVWSPRLSKASSLSLALMYNLQGSRIHAVGVSGLGDVRQSTLHTLNLNAKWNIDEHFSFKAQINNILSQSVTFKQKVPMTNEEIVVERYNEGVSFELEITYKL